MNNFLWRSVFASVIATLVLNLLGLPFFFIPRAFKIKGFNPLFKNYAIKPPFGLKN